MACFIFLIQTRLPQKPSKIGTTSFGSVKLEIWILQNQHRICKLENQGCERERLTGGPTGQRDPLDSDTETGETLVAGETRWRRGLGRIQGHLRVPLLKANVLTYFTRALLDPRVLAVANGGAAVLRGVTPANLGNSDTVDVADEQERLKAKL